MVAGPSAWWIGMGAVLTLLFPVMGVVMVRQGAGWMGWWFILFPGVLLYWLGRQVLWVMSGRGWVVRWNGRRMLVRIGEVFERDIRNVKLLELDRGEMQWVRKFVSTTISKSGQDTESNSTRWLEIKLATADLRELRQQLAEARTPKVWRGWSRSREVPVSLTNEGVLRVEWVGRNVWMAPGLKKALRRLAADGVMVREEVSETNDFTVPTADKEKMERRIMELVEQGQMIEAVKLTRTRYGYSLKEAKDFVEQLRGK